jgi:hypothetical protein
MTMKDVISSVRLDATILTYWVDVRTKAGWQRQNRILTMKIMQIYLRSIYFPGFMRQKSNTNVDEFVKSRQETTFVTYHEGHEEHEAEIIKYFLALRVLRALRGENQTLTNTSK